MTVIRGKGLGLEIALAGGDIDAALDDLEARLRERGAFYSGTSAGVLHGAVPPNERQLERLRALLAAAGITLAGLAAAPPVALIRRRANRPEREPAISESARSLVADFAGARADIAERRRKGEASVRRLEPRPAKPPAMPPLQAVADAPQTLYHVGTLRGGQALHSLGHIVIVGDVNPGAELVAAGDIVVFGRLAGVAHAGAQGESGARVYALDLDATQVRIATFIAADANAPSGTPPRPEVAVVRDGRIVVVPLERLDAAGASGT